MTHFLDEETLDFSRRETQELLRILETNIWSSPAIQAIAARAGLPLHRLTLQNSAAELWPEVLLVASQRLQLKLLLQTIVEDPDLANIAPRVEQFLSADPVTEAPGAVGSILALPALAQGDLEKQLEAEPTLLDVAFLERGLQLARAVVKLEVTLDGERFHGTAFRIGADLLLTNHHVLFGDSGAPASAVDVWVGYERSFGGADRVPTVITGDPTSIKGAQDHDWAVVRVNTALADDVTTIRVDEAEAHPVAVRDRVYIIQHPNGEVKKIGMVHNVVRYVDADVINYRTDTEKGSSGSPVFDEQWRLVALHHRSVKRTIDGTTEDVNQGRRIERVHAGLVAAGLL